MTEAPDLPGEFERILAPMALEQFFREHWNRRPLHVHGPAHRFIDLLNRDAFIDLLPHCGEVKAGFYDRNGWYCELPARPDQVKRLWEAGMTICAGVLPPDRRRSAVTESYRRTVAFAGDVYFNAYMSPDGHGFGLHIDDHPVFVLQVEGSKQWSISAEIGVPDPVRGFSFPPDRGRMNLPWGSFEQPDETQFLQVTLEPGDALYLPAGSSATSPCTTAPMIAGLVRFWLRNAGATGGLLKVEVLVKGGTYYAGTITAGSSWSPSPMLLSSAPYYSGAVAYQVRLTPVGTGSAFNVDDVYFDPYCSR